MTGQILTAADRNDRLYLMEAAHRALVYGMGALPQDIEFAMSRSYFKTAAAFVKGSEYLNRKDSRLLQMFPIADELGLNVSRILTSDGMPLLVATGNYGMNAQQVACNANEHRAVRPIERSFVFELDGNNLVRDSETSQPIAQVTKPQHYETFYGVLKQQAQQTIH